MAKRRVGKPPSIHLKGYGSDIDVTWDEKMFRSARFFFLCEKFHEDAHRKLAGAAAAWETDRGKTESADKPPTSQKYANTFNSVDTFDRRLSELASHLPKSPPEGRDQAFRKLRYLVQVGLANFHAWFEERKTIKINKTLLLIIIGFLTISTTSAQTKLTINETLELAIKNNASLKASQLKIDKNNALVQSAFSFDKTSIYYNSDDNNLAPNNVPIKVFGISQDIKFPTLYFAEKKVNKAKVNLEKANYNLRFLQFKKEVYEHYYQLSYAKNKVKAYHFLFIAYQNFAKKAERRYELGETNYLEMITAKSKQKQLETTYKQALQEVLYSKEKLKSIVQVDTLSIIEQPLVKLKIKNTLTKENLGTQYFEEAKRYQNALFKKEKQNLLPDFSFEYFQGTNNLLNSNIKGYQVGIKIPFLFSGNTSKIKASNIANEIVDAQQQDYKIKLKAKYNSLLATLKQYEEAINYYENEGETLKNEITKTANRTFKEGEIDFFKYIQSIEIAKDFELSYLNNLNAYNQTVININHLILNTY